MEELIHRASLFQVQDDDQATHGRALSGIFRQLRSFDGFVTERIGIFAGNPHQIATDINGV